MEDLKMETDLFAIWQCLKFPTADVTEIPHHMWLFVSTSHLASHLLRPLTH
jgi:hypothetical protein